MMITTVIRSSSKQHEPSGSSKLLQVLGKYNEILNPLSIRNVTNSHGRCSRHPGTLRTRNWLTFSIKTVVVRHSWRGVMAGSPSSARLLKQSGWVLTVLSGQGETAWLGDCVLPYQSKDMMSVLLEYTRHTEGRTTKAANRKICNINFQATGQSPRHSWHPCTYFVHSCKWTVSYTWSLSHLQDSYCLSRQTTKLKPCQRHTTGILVTF